MKKTIGCSVICMDHLNFERELIFLDSCGIDYFHLDVMDGSYVPRFGIYPEIIQEMAKISNTPMDLHIMTQNPLFTFDEFKSVSNITHVSIHLEGNENTLIKISDQVRDYGKKFGLICNLDSDKKRISDLINLGVVDSLMFMGIVPGVLKQMHRPNILLENLRYIKNAVPQVDEMFVQADGGVNFETISEFSRNGINNFVCGTSTLFKDRKSTASFEVNSKKFQENLELVKLKLLD